MAIYWFLAFAIAWAITLPPALAKFGLIGPSPIPTGLGVLIGLAPLIAAAVAAARGGEGKAYWRSLGRLPRPGWTIAFALILPPALLALTALVHEATGSPLRLSLDTGILPFALMWLVLAFGEEAGWRGFALPRLVERHGFWPAATLLGLVWCVWHYPKLLGSPYLGSFAETVPLLALFSLQVVIANYILCWIYYRSGRSVIAATLYHASFNTVATIHFMAATDLVITAGLAAVVAVIAILDPRPDRRGPQSTD